MSRPSTISSVLLAGALTLGGCDEARTHLDAAAEPDDAASAMDAASVDAYARPEVGLRDTNLNPDVALAPTDAGMDAPAPRDAFALDAASVLDAAREAGVASDAGAGVTLACAPVVPSDATSGLLFSSNLWPGFRFQVTRATRTQRVGLQLRPDAAGTAFAAIVRLTGASDTPDAADLSSADVIARADVTLPSATSSVVVSTDLDVALDPGWYALVFGTTGTGGTLPSAGGAGCVSSPGSSYPFTIRQSDGMFILQGAEPHLFVSLAP